MNASQNKIANEVANNGFVFEALESREMMSVSHHHHAKPKAAPKVPTPVPTPVPAPIVINNAALTITQTGGVLQVIGTTGNDQIKISQLGSVFTITNGSWKTTVTGTFTQVVVKGNNGNDSITIDPSVTENASLYGGTGNDSTLIGNNANDSFYAGAGTNIMKGGAGRRHVRHDRQHGRLDHRWRRAPTASGWTTARPKLITDASDRRQRASRQLVPRWRLDDPERPDLRRTEDDRQHDGLQELQQPAAVQRERPLGRRHRPGVRR